MTKKTKIYIITSADKKPIQHKIISNLKHGYELEMKFVAYGKTGVAFHNFMVFFNRSHARQFRAGLAMMDGKDTYTVRAVQAVPKGVTMKKGDLALWGIFWNRCNLGYCPFYIPMVFDNRAKARQWASYCKSVFGTYPDIVRLAYAK